MNDRNEKIINAIIKKADALCPDSLALIGVYGSVATRDEYEKSDLDLMVLINDENGQILADGFIIAFIIFSFLSFIAYPPDIFCFGVIHFCIQ